MLRLVRCCAVAGAVLAAPGSTAAQSPAAYPDRPIRLVVAFVAGGASVLSRNEALDPWLAIPFGAGAALTLDESALLLKLDDVYWTEEGVVSVQISLAALAMASAIGVARRMLRRGEREVLPEAQGPLF